MHKYIDIVSCVLAYGEIRSNRTGTDTLSMFNFNYQIDLADGFPLLTTKKISWKNIVAELVWFLSGDPKTTILDRHECKFWKPWTNEHGYVPSAYGKYWRDYPSQNGSIDQLWYAVWKLLKNPNDRRAVVSAWEPGNALISDLPPCHAFFVLTTHDGRLNLHLTQRSCDVGLGLPYNIASYGLLIHILAGILHIEPGVFAHSIVDAHVYVNHIPALEEQITRPPYNLPTLNMDPILGWNDVTALCALETDDLMDRFKLENYQHHPAIKLEVAA